MTSKTTELVSFANELADEARKVILPFWRKPIEIESKMEHDRPIAESPVTIADRQAEQVRDEIYFSCDWIISYSGTCFSCSHNTSYIFTSRR